MIARRGFVAFAACTALAPAVFAQAKEMKRVCVLLPYPEGGSDFEARRALLVKGLARYGWRNQDNIDLLFRGANGYESIPESARRMRDEKCDVFVGAGSAALEFRRASPETPVIGIALAESVIGSLIGTYAKPGVNLTGFLRSDQRVVQKQVELLEEAVPDLEQIAILLNPDSPSFAAFASAMAADPSDIIRRLNLSSSKRLTAHYFRSTAEFEQSLLGLSRENRVALLVLPQTFSTSNRKALLEIASRYRLPAIYGSLELAREGGLMAYSTDILQQFELAGKYVDQILKGEKAGELPLQFPTKFELVVNARTARQLGLTFPLSFLARADEVIE